MDKAEYIRTIERIAEEGYGWNAIKDLTKIMQIAYENHEKVMREALWERRTARKILKSDQSNKAKVSSLQDILGEDGEARVREFLSKESQLRCYGTQALKL